MPQAATAFSFPVDFGNAEAGSTLLTKRALKYWRGEEKMDNARRVAINAAHDEGQRLRDELNNAHIEVGLIEREIARNGQYQTEKKTELSDGSVRTEFTRQPVWENAKKKVERIKQAIKENADHSRFPVSNFDIVKSFAERLRPSVKLIDAELPEPPKPLVVGETARDTYERQVIKTITEVDALDSIWRASRTNAELRADIPNQIKRLAKPISIGGLAQGYSDDNFGNRKVETPNRRLGVAQKHQLISGQAVFFDDVIGTLAAVAPQLLADHLYAQIDARSDEGRISAAEKPAILAAQKKKIWQQRRVTEAAFIAAREAGFVNIKRPKDTPAEIILGIATKWDSVATSIDDAGIVADELPDDLAPVVDELPDDDAADEKAAKTESMNLAQLARAEAEDETEWDK
jgi:hypothetical protein